MIQLDCSQADPAAIYKLMIGAIVPRPIAWVSTQSKSGLGNLAPFSFFNGVCSRPPCLVFSITRNRDGSKKDTLRNIEETAEFVVNSAQVSHAKEVTLTSGEYPFGTDELKIAGLTPIPSIQIKPSRVKEAQIHFECKTEKLIEIGDGGVGSATLVVGQILMLHVADELYKDGAIDIQALDPLSRLGGITYGKTREMFDIPRPRMT